MRANFLSISFLIFLAAAVVSLSPTRAVTFTWSEVGDAGNAADTTSYGAVAYEYRIATTEVNLTQYTEFLNAVAETDLYGLYNASMSSDARIAGISRSGSSGSYAYTVMGSGLRPVTYVSSYDAMRFTNWLHNGQGSGSTETGSYTLSTGSIVQVERSSNVATVTSAGHTLSVGDQVTVSGASSGYNGTAVVTGVTANTFSYVNSGADEAAAGSGGSLMGASATHGADAEFWVPTEDEWYKAAYYDPTKGGSGGYWLYPTGSDSVPTGNTIGVADSANFFDGNYAQTENGLPTRLTEGGAYGSNSASYYGTFDQGGNVWEWNEALVRSLSRGLRGGTWAYNEEGLRSSFRNESLPEGEDFFVGFRVAGVPEPTTIVMILLGGVALLAWKPRRATF